MAKLTMQVAKDEGYDVIERSAQGRPRSGFTWIPITDDPDFKAVVPKEDAEHYEPQRRSSSSKPAGRLSIAQSLRNLLAQEARDSAVNTLSQLTPDMLDKLEENIKMARSRAEKRAELEEKIANLQEQLETI